MKTETITVSFDVEINYANNLGREYMLKRLPAYCFVDVAGAGVDERSYSMKSVANSAKIAVRKGSNHETA